MNTHQTCPNYPSADSLPVIGFGSCVLKAASGCNTEVALDSDIEDGRFRKLQVWLGLSDQPNSMGILSSKIDVGPVNKSDGSRKLSFYSYRPCHTNFQGQGIQGLPVPVEVYQTDIKVGRDWGMERSEHEKYLTSTIPNSTNPVHRRQLIKHPQTLTYLDGLEKSGQPYHRVSSEQDSYIAQTCVMSEKFNLAPEIVDGFRCKEESVDSSEEDAPPQTARRLEPWSLQP